MNISSASLSSQVSMDADPSPPSRNLCVNADYPRTLGQTHDLSVDAIVGPEDSGTGFHGSMGVPRDQRQPVNQPSQTSRNLSQPRPEVRTFNPDRLKESEPGFSSFGTNDSSYSSMGSIGASSLPSDDWKDELKLYEDKMPPAIRMGFLDVLILYHEDDRPAAEKFRQHLMSDIKVENGPIKTMLYDDEEMVAICGSLIGHLDQAVQRSTYVFIYMTKTFVSDKWCEFQSESCLMEAITNPYKMWCVVPVYTEKRNKSFRVPMGLNTLKGINYYNDDQFYRKGVARLIGDKINVRIQADKDHAIEQKKWLEDYKRKQLMHEEKKRRVVMYEENKTREAEEWVQKETEKLIRMGVLPQAIHHSASDSDMIRHPPVLHHSHSVNTLKPVQPQNSAVREYFNELLHQQQAEGYNYQNYSQEQLENIERVFCREQPAKTAPTKEHLISKFPYGQALIPPVERSAAYSQHQPAVNRTVPESNAGIKPPVRSLNSDEPVELPIELIKGIQHLSIDEQEKLKQEYFQQVREVHQQQQNQQQQQNYQQQQLQQQQYQQQQQQLQQQQHHHQQLQQYQQQQQQFQQLQQQRGMQSPRNSQPLSNHSQDSVHKDMPDSLSTHGTDTNLSSSSLGPTMPAFDQLNSTSSSSSASSIGNENWVRSGSVPLSQNTSAHSHERHPPNVSSQGYQQASVDGSRSLLPGNLPNNSLLDWSNETDGGPSPPPHKHLSAPLSGGPAQYENVKNTQISDKDVDKSTSKTGARKKEKVVKRVTINVYNAGNVQIGDHNLLNKNTINQASDDTDDDEDDVIASPDIKRADITNTANPAASNPMMKKVEIPSGTSSHAELGTQVGNGPCTVDAAPSTVVTPVSTSPEIQNNDKIGVTGASHLTSAKATSLPQQQITGAVTKEREPKESTSSPKNDDSQSSTKSTVKSFNFENSVNMYSSESEKPSVQSIQKEIPSLSSPEKTINKCKPQVAKISPIIHPVAKISPMVHDPPNENEDVTCEKTVVDSEYTARKVPIDFNEQSDDQDQTCVKEVVSVSCTAVKCEPRPCESEVKVKTMTQSGDKFESNDTSVFENTENKAQGAPLFSAGRQTNVRELFFNNPKLLPTTLKSFEDEESLGASDRRDESIDKCEEVREEPTEGGAGDDFEVIEDFYNEPSSGNEVSSSFEESGRIRGNRWSRKGSPKNDKDCCIS
ncbi:Transmembrane emp24 domain-containing protein 7 [Mactra antiquata]